MGREWRAIAGGPLGSRGRGDSLDCNSEKGGMRQV